MRIVSLLPSATEIICALGLKEELVGVTHECDYPHWAKDLPKVTTTLIPQNASSSEIDALVRERLKRKLALYSLNLPVLKSLRPDLLVTQNLCEVCAVAESEVEEALCHLPGDPSVVNLEPSTLREVFDSLIILGSATGKEAEAEAAVQELGNRVEEVKKRSRRIPSRDLPRVAFLEWIDPLFNAGHWTPELIELAGGHDVLGENGKPSRSITPERLVASQPDVVFIACCGFGSERTMADLHLLRSTPYWRDLPSSESGRVYVSNGSDYFSRPGPRLVDSLEILAHALHPAVHPIPQDSPAAVRVFDV